MVNSSLGFEILLYLNIYYFCLFACIEFGIIAFKIIHFPFTKGTLISEILILIFLSCTEAMRIFMGHKGNLTEKAFSVIFSLGLTVPSVLGVIYFLIWQVYVLRLELILCGIQLFLQSLESCFAVICLIRFCKTGTY